MKNRLLILGMASGMLATAGCQESELEAPEKPAAEKEAAAEEGTPAEKVAPEEEPVAEEKLAAPGDVPEGFESLKLTEDQAAKVNEWLAGQGDSPDPADMVVFLKSVLRDDQQAALDELIKQASPAPAPE